MDRYQLTYMILNVTRGFIYLLCLVIYIIKIWHLFRQYWSFLDIFGYLRYLRYLSFTSLGHECINDSQTLTHTWQTNICWDDGNRYELQTLIPLVFINMVFHSALSRWLRSLYHNVGCIVILIFALVLKVLKDWI